MKQVKVEWCENFIKKTFKKQLPYATGIECNCFWTMAERSGLWERGTYGTPMSDALGNLCSVETATDVNGDYAYSFFKLK